VKSSEKRWIIWSALILVFVTTIPYVLGYASEDQDWRFTGFVYGVEDGNSYIAKMQLGETGEWLFRTPYSAEHQDGVLAFVPYMLLGKLAGGEAVHTQLVVLYQVFRLAAIPITLIAIYSLAGLFVKEVFWRKWITLLASVGGGVGWSFLLFGIEQIAGSLPLEWFSPEWFGFISFYGQPHLLLARGLLLYGLSQYLISPFRSAYGWRAGLTFFILGLIHPLSLVSSGAVVASHQLGVLVLSALRKQWTIALRWMKAAFRALLLPAPIVIYSVIKFSTDPFLRQWTAQNRILTPQPIHILIAYGLMIPWVLLGIRPLFRRRPWSGILPLMWVAALPFLAYAPHNLQRRLPEGVWIAILILAAAGFVRLTTTRFRFTKALGITWIILSIPTSILLIAGGIRVASMPSVPVFRPADEVKVFEWLVANAEPNQVVMSSFETGNALPAWAPFRVVIGHGPESVNLEAIQDKVDRFYKGKMKIDEAQSFLREFDVAYIFNGPTEEGAVEISLANLVYEMGDYQLFQVRRP
jgi:hypothetical protein